MKYNETEKLELKKSTSELRDGIKSICAILNKHQKGKLIFGVKPSGEVVGQEVGANTLRDISQQIANSIEPKIFPEVYEEIIEGKDCIVVEFEGLNIPYYAYGRAYMRVSDEDRLLSAKELERLILDKNKDKLRWDSEICEGASLEDIDEERLKWFLKEYGKEFEEIRDSLEKLGLMKKDNLSNCAIALFGKTPKKFFRNLKLRCAVFGTKDTFVSIDMQEFEGNLFDLIEAGEKYFLQHIDIGMKIEGLKRVNVPEIDKAAFREAIINSFCHRDYWNQDNVHLAIFKDRVEIRSPGLLFGGLTIKRIREEKVSERRNELIAEMLNKVNFVESWGKGIGKILRLESETEFKELGRKFYTIFRRKKAPQVTPQVTPQVSLTELEKKIVFEIQKDRKVSRNKLAEILGISSDTVKEYFEKLKEKNVLERVGKTSGGYWKIK